MAGDAHVDDAQFKGLAKYFNSTTIRGRANIAIATYSALGVLGLYFALKPKKTKEPKEIAK